MHQRTHAPKIISTGRHRVARVRTSRRKLAVAVPAALVAAGAFVAIPAASASSPVFPTMNDSGGVYWRSGTNWNTPIAKSGYGVYPGTKISVSCYQMGTANVPGSADAMWVKASWASGPGTGSGWINEHFVNDGAPINKAAPGVPSCTPTPSPSSSTETSTEAAAVKWAESMVGSNLGTSGQKYWYGCLAFAFDAYRIGANFSQINNDVTVPVGSNTYPADLWPVNQSKGNFRTGSQGTDNSPPPGALVFWDSTGGTGDSHVAISVGGGKLVSTNVDQSSIPGYNGIHYETMSQFAQNTWNIYKGWWLPDK